MENKDRKDLRVSQDLKEQGDGPPGQQAEFGPPGLLGPNKNKLENHFLRNLEVFKLER